MKQLVYREDCNLSEITSDMINRMMEEHKITRRTNPDIDWSDEQAIHNFVYDLMQKCRIIINRAPTIMEV